MWLSLYPNFRRGNGISVLLLFAPTSKLEFIPICEMLCLR
jgi:hypothetical protein